MDENKESLEDFGLGEGTVPAHNIGMGPKGLQGSDGEGGEG